MLPLERYRQLPLGLRPGLESPVDAYYAPVVNFVRARQLASNPTSGQTDGQSFYFVGEDGAMEIPKAPRYLRSTWDGEDAWQLEMTNKVSAKWKQLNAPIIVPRPTWKTIARTRLRHWLTAVGII